MKFNSESVNDVFEEFDSGDIESLNPHHEANCEGFKVRAMPQKGDHLPIQIRVNCTITLINQMEFDALGVCITSMGRLYPYFGVNGHNFIGFVLDTNDIYRIETRN
jgi:hypothetical protein